MATGACRAAVSDMGELEAILKRLEWSGMYSYSTGWPACPICRGIKPGHGRDSRGVLPDNQGHMTGCAMADALGLPTNPRDWLSI